MKRRELLQWMALSATATALPPIPSWAQAKKETETAKALLQKKIPSSGLLLPVIGMGTWITFNVGESERLRNDRTEVLKAFFAKGGGLIDSSPMYGSAEEVVGYGLKKLGSPKSLFSATKIWTSSTPEGKEQLAQSKKLWGVENFDLEQVHNLVNWQAHLKYLFELKEKGQIKHVGITTSHGRRHDEFEQIMKSQPLDFVQLTYNIEDREAEKKLLDLAKDRGIAVIANRPYGGGSIINKYQGKALPAWAPEAGMKNWPEFLLKFVVSHPAVTCAIPATSKVEHMRENMGACQGELPDAATRQKMLKAIESL